jgi:hypothetical protein
VESIPYDPGICVIGRARASEVVESTSAQGNHSGAIMLPLWFLPAVDPYTFHASVTRKLKLFTRCDKKPQPQPLCSQCVLWRFDRYLLSTRSWRLMDYCASWLVIELLFLSLYVAQNFVVPMAWRKLQEPLREGLPLTLNLRARAGGTTS